MTDSDPVAADPAPAPDPAPASAPELPALAETYPLCFDWERPKPLKIGIHLDLRARHPDMPHLAIRKALAVIATGRAISSPSKPVCCGGTCKASRPGW